MSHYDTLGVSKTASELEIKKAYRSLSLKYHPDRNPTEDAATKIREINDAYEVLSDSSKRRQYDMEQQLGQSMGGMGRGPGMGGFPFGFPGHPSFMHMSSMDEMSDVNDIFSALFGNMGGMGPGGHGNIHRMQGMHGMPEIRIFHNGHPVNVGGGHGHPFGPMFRHIQKPDPIVMVTHISMEQAYAGCTIPVEVGRWTMVGDVKIQEEETLYVTIPPGTDDNEIIHLKEKGNLVAEDCKGDVKLTIQVDNMTPFKRSGLDLIFRKTISLKEALCGFAFEISHLNGKMLSINNKTHPTIVRPNYRKIVPDLGMLRDGRSGALIIEFDVEFPESLTGEQIETLLNVL